MAVPVLAKVWSTGESPTSSDLNANFAALLAALNAGLDATNFSPSLGLPSSAITGVALVAAQAGTQTVTALTKFSAGALEIDPVAANNVGTAITGDAGTVTALKQFQKIRPTVNSAVTINTLLGGVVGQIIWILTDSTAGGASTTITLASGTAVNTFRGKAASSVLNTSLGNNNRQMAGAYLFGDPHGTGVNQWHEL